MFEVSVLVHHLNLTSAHLLEFMKSMDLKYDIMLVEMTRIQLQNAFNL